MSEPLTVGVLKRDVDTQVKAANDLIEIASELAKVVAELQRSAPPSANNAIVSSVERLVNVSNALSDNARQVGLAVVRSSR